MKETFWRSAFISGNGSEEHSSTLQGATQLLLLALNELIRPRRKNRTISKHGQKQQQQPTTLCLFMDFCFMAKASQAPEKLKT